MRPSKYAIAAPQRQEPGQAGKPPPAACDRCGWLFHVENPKLRKFTTGTKTSTRTEPRSQVNLPGGIIRCCDCYEVELWQCGRHTQQGGIEVNKTYREALGL